MPPVRVCRRRSGPVCPLRENPPGECPEGASLPQRNRGGFPAACFAGGGGKSPHRPGRAPRHLHGPAVPPEFGFGPPGKPAQSRVLPGRDPPVGIPDHPGGGRRPACPPAAGGGLLPGRGSGLFPKGGKVDRAFPGQGDFSSLCGTWPDTSRACRSAWTTRRSGSSAGFPVRAFQRAAARKPGSTWPESPGRWSC